MSYDSELAEFRRILDEVTVVGHPKRDEELAVLQRLVDKYPEETAALLAGPHQA